MNPVSYLFEFLLPQRRLTPSFLFRVGNGKGSRWSAFLPPDDVPEDGDARLENHCDSFQSKLPQVKISKNAQAVKGPSQQNTMG